jgi:ABC-type branched-subunit amino acid transport system substrate-binding protein
MKTSHSRRFLLVGALVATALLAALACGGEKEKSENTAGASPAATQSTGSENVPGVTDTQILLGSHFALSQSPATAYAPIMDGYRAYFDYVNSQGGVYGRKIKLIVGDDHYNPADTLEVVRKLVEQDHVFAMIGCLGESTHTTVWKYLEEQGIPDLFQTSGIVKWTEPVAHTRFGGNPDYYTEGKMLGQYIAQHYAGKKLGLLLQNDEIGVDGEKGLRDGLEGSDVEIVARETFETTQWDVTAQTQRLKNANPDVVAAYAIPPPAASLVKVSREVLNWDVPFVVSGVNASDVFAQLAGAQNAEGAVSVVFGKQLYQTDDPAIQLHLQIMKDFGQGVPPSNFTLYGAAMAEIMVKGLQNAGPNLTRESLIEGLESIRDWCCTACMVPVNMSPTDHRPMEMEFYIKLHNGNWEPFGDPISFESTPGKVIACKGMGEPVYAGEGG